MPPTPVVRDVVRGGVLSAAVKEAWQIVVRPGVHEVWRAVGFVWLLSSSWRLAVALIGRCWLGWQMWMPFVLGLVELPQPS